ncbi:MAG TPA: hypothetical protein VF600_14170 [Abditibacteriaceae bacterium]
MSFDAQRLYDLLPAIYRIRDAEQGEPLQLRALMEVIAEQVGVIEEDLEQLYDDQFIETCAEWVVPYIGDLIGYHALHSESPKIGSPRAEVAHTIGFRRRKGTASMLEQLARDVTGWNARAVEFFQLLATTQYMNHIRPTNHYAPDLRQWEPLERLNSAFESVAHTVDVRHIAQGDGRYNIPNIGLYLWRLDAYPLSDSPAVKVDNLRYVFSPLGNNTQLFTRPQSEDEIAHLAEPINVPAPISRRVLDEYLENYYGKDASLFLNVNGADVDVTEIQACNLSDAGGGAWAHQPQTKIAIDPVLGRIAFPASQTPREVRVWFHYGFSTETGGGEYERAATFNTQLPHVEEVTMPALIQDALDGVLDGGIVQINDSGRYNETLTINLNAGKHLELRAANEHRPTLLLGGDMKIDGGTDSEVTLHGLLISGATLRVLATANNKLRKLRLRHCTLVPGLSLDIDGNPQKAKEPSLVVETEDVEVEIDHCIIGGLRIADGNKVTITNSIVDATATTEVAFSAPDNKAAGGQLHIVNSTVIGKVHTTLLELASNTIFLAELATGDGWTAPVRAARKQEGCVRFSYVPLASVVPRRYYCRPQTEAEALRVRPRFTSLRYGDAGYAQLSRPCAKEIRQGADDESEMGVFHDVFAPQRETNLRLRLDEYLRFGLEAGIFYAT